MKKLILMAAVAVLLAACDKKTKLGPEYNTGVEFGKIEYSSLIPDTDVEVTCTLTSLYGIYSAWVDYQIGDDPTVRNVGSQLYDGTDKTNTTWHYSATIPGQPAGTKITFRIFSYTPYGVLSFSSIVVYTVEAEEEPA